MRATSYWSLPQYHFWPSEQWPAQELLQQSLVRVEWEWLAVDHYCPPHSSATRDRRALAAYRCDYRCLRSQALTYRCYYRAGYQPRSARDERQRPGLAHAYSGQQAASPGHAASPARQLPVDQPARRTARVEASGDAGERPA